MRFLHVIPSVDPKGGGTIEGAHQLHRALTGLGHDGAFVTLDAPDATTLQQFDAPIYPLGPALSGYGYGAQLVPWLRTHAAEFDAVLVNGLWQYPGLATRRALAGSPTPYFVFPHGMLDPWFKHAYPLKHLKKWLYWPWAEYRVLRDATGVLFTCDEERLLARKSFWLYRAREFISSYGTASPPRTDAITSGESFLQAFPQLRGKRLILFLGRIHEKKGCDLLIEAFAKVCRDMPDAHLVLAGPDSGALPDQLRNRIAQLGMQARVTWTGMLSGDKKWGAFHASDAFCLPSHQENFGIAVVEALACGCPVLISDKVNIWREIQADRSGLVESDTLEGAEALLDQWFKTSPEDAARMREAAVRSFDARFQMEQVARNLIDIVQRSTGGAIKDTGEHHAHS